MSLEELKGGINTDLFLGRWLFASASLAPTPTTPCTSRHVRYAVVKTRASATTRDTEHFPFAFGLRHFFSLTIFAAFVGKKQKAQSAKAQRQCALCGPHASSQGRGRYQTSFSRIQWWIFCESLFVNAHYAFGHGRGNLKRGAANPEPHELTAALPAPFQLYVGAVFYTLSHYRPIDDPHAAARPAIRLPDPTSNSQPLVARRAGEPRPAPRASSPPPLAGDCVTFKLELKGSRYTHDTWSSLQFSGLAGDTFKALSVPAGSDEDPQSGNCENYKLDQLVLVSERGYLVGGLSCSNQEITVTRQTTTQRACTARDKTMRSTAGPYSPKRTLPRHCDELYECGVCLAHGSKGLAEKVVTDEPVGTKCIWCKEEGACMAYKDRSSAFPCTSATGYGGGFPGGDSCASDGNTQYLTFEWNNGRVNNNMVSWSAAMALGKHLGRVVVITQPIVKSMSMKGARRGDPNFGRSAFLGIFEGMWDLDNLRSHGYKVVLETSVDKEILALGGQNTEASCKVHSGFPPKNRYSACRVVHMPNPFSYKSLRAQRVKEFIIPAKWLREASERIIGEKLGSVIQVAVHQRHHAWGNAKLHGSKFLCRGKLKNIYSTNIGEPYRSAASIWARDAAKSHKMLHFTQLSCAADYGETERVLRYWRVQMPQKFFLASDREEKDRFQSMVAHGGVSLEQSDYESLPQIQRAYERHKAFRWDCKDRYCAPRAKFLQLTGVYLDMWGMTLGKFFMGGYYSTMSDTVCFWRGWDRMNASNICFLPHRLRKGWVDVNDNEPEGSPGK